MERDVNEQSARYPAATTVAEFRANLAAVRARIDAAALGAGRDPAEVRLLPVSKTVPAERLRAAVEAGCRELGENKVQEARRKSEELADLGVAWSVIGHLQTNKAKDVAAFAAEFQALGRMADPGEVGDPVVYLCSDAARGMTGQAISHCGGQVMW